MEQVLTYDNVLLYWRALFTKYASLLRFKVRVQHAFFVSRSRCNLQFPALPLPVVIKTRFRDPFLKADFVVWRQVELRPDAVKMIAYLTMVTTRVDHLHL